MSNRKELLAGNNRGQYAYTIYTYFRKCFFFLLLFSPVVCGCCALCILGIFLRVFVAFVCFLGSSVVWLLMFIGYLAAWLLVFFTCQWAHSWRHVAHLDRNSIFDVFVSWLCGFCIASLADVVFLRQWWFDLRIAVSWIICFQVSNFKMQEKCHRPKSKNSAERLSNRQSEQ